jgi:DNA repair protein RadC
LKSNNPHSGHRKRLREQVLKSGLESLHEHQVLEYLLTFVLPQKDTNVIAHDLIQKFGSFYKVMQASLTELMSVNGVGEVVAHFLFNFRDFFYYYQKSSTKEKTLIRNFEEAKRYVIPHLSNKLKEELLLVCIDSKNCVIDTKVLSRGTVNQADVNMRAITEILINNNTSNFVIAHNHPDGNCRPSAEDDKFTQALTVTSEINRMKLLDHIIIGNDGIYSYYQNDKLIEYRDKVKNLIVKSEEICSNFAEYEGVR